MTYEGFEIDVYSRRELGLHETVRFLLNVPPRIDRADVMVDDKRNHLMFEEKSLECVTTLLSDQDEFDSARAVLLFYQPDMRYGISHIYLAPNQSNDEIFENYGHVLKGDINDRDLKGWMRVFSYVQDPFTGVPCPRYFRNARHLIGQLVNENEDDFVIVTTDLDRLNRLYTKHEFEMQFEGVVRKIMQRKK